jgi:two-component system cell cycle response regulator CtrA
MRVENALAVENEELRERVRQLEEIITGFEPDFPREFQITPSEAQVLRALMLSGMTTKDHLMHVLYGARQGDPPRTEVLNVYVCKLRSKLLKFGISIDTVWGRGYAMSPASKAILKYILTPEPVL